ncbi:S-layer homology domain-containing protein [Brevibacillus sp. SYSU BS000544]|uniref:S-layer homology domain-containing protein n=1 Tax=Brevibacillus sp. SYSU BS000544 TaxID=3416443 RepID=UPI003CE476C8
MKKRQAKGISLALVFALSGGLVPVSLDQTPIAYAATAAKQSDLTREEALKKVAELIKIPVGATLENLRYEEAHPRWGNNFATWNFGWRGKDEQSISVTLEAKTGTLINYHIWYRNDNAEKGGTKLSEKETHKIALDFLEKVAPDVAGKLSEPNEFTGSDSYWLNGLEQQNVHFTRIENKIPFLENSIDVVINSKKEVVGFQRRWTDEKLPEATAKVTKEQGEKLLDEMVKPSLSFIRINDYIGRYGQNPNKYSLVYQYGASDPIMVDANSGSALTPSGVEFKTAKQITPLGDTSRPVKPKGAKISKQEAQKIAEEWIKKIPGKYQSAGSNGGGASSDESGVTIRDWSFQFIPENSTEKRDRGIELRINEYGEFVGFTNEAKNDVIFGESSSHIENPISWKVAEQNATALIKNLYSDRLGDIYAMDQEPSAEMQKQMFKDGERAYSIRFGWLHKGIPVEDQSMSVEIDPRDGEPVQLHTGREGAQAPEGNTNPSIDAKQAVEVEGKEKKVMLTYFQAGFNYRYGGPVESTAPILVYRYVGDTGVVDANTGKWINFNELQKLQKSPEDLASHPQSDALSFAIEHSILQVTDGKVEPDRVVTRGEFVSALVKMTNRIEFHHRYRNDWDEETAEIQFADVPLKHPYYGFIQQAVQMGLIENSKGQFQPDQPMTRLQAAELIVNFVGYKPLLENKEIFANHFADVDAKSAPAAVIASSLGLIQPKSAKEFQPSEPLTRAELAQLYSQLIKKFGSE